MSQFRKIALTIGVQLLLWSHLLAYSGVHILQIKTYFNVKTEFNESENEDSKDANENLVEEEAENEEFPNLLPFACEFCSFMSIEENASKLNSYFALNHPSTKIDIPSPPPKN